MTAGAGDPQFPPAARSMRVSKEVELEGLDVPEFGMPAYPEDEIVNAESEGAMARV
jgi:hypothetical protein